VQPWALALVELIKDDDVRAAFSAGFFFVYLASMVAFLSFFPIPDENKNTVHLIVGGLVGAGIGPAIQALLDKRPRRYRDSDSG
jgi:hypothetical protein